LFSLAGTAPGIPTLPGADTPVRPYTRLG